MDGNKPKILTNEFQILISKRQILKTLPQSSSKKPRSSGLNPQSFQKGSHPFPQRGNPSHRIKDLNIKLANPRSRIGSINRIQRVIFFLEPKRNSILHYILQNQFTIQFSDRCNPYKSSKEYNSTSYIGNNLTIICLLLSILLHSKVSYLLFFHKLGKINLQQSQILPKINKTIDLLLLQLIICLVSISHTAKQKAKAFYFSYSTLFF
jgi:hypothetical protein